MLAPPLREIDEVLRDGMYRASDVVRVLQDGPKTIPEMAEALRAPAREVLLWVMALRRYGRVSELPKGPTDDYYRYQLKEGTE